MCCDKVPLQHIQEEIKLKYAIIVLMQRNNNIKQKDLDKFSLRKFLAMKYLRKFPKFTQEIVRLSFLTYISRGEVKEGNFICFTSFSNAIARYPQPTHMTAKGNVKMC